MVLFLQVHNALMSNSTLPCGKLRHRRSVNLQLSKLQRICAASETTTTHRLFLNLGGRRCSTQGTRRVRAARERPAHTTRRMKWRANAASDTTAAHQASKRTWRLKRQPRTTRRDTGCEPRHKHQRQSQTAASSNIGQPTGRRLKRQPRVWQETRSGMRARRFKR